jgi:hypothetical protein
MQTFTRAHLVTAIAGTLAVSAPAGALFLKALTPAPTVSAKPVMMRWLDEGQGRPNRYALSNATLNGANAAPHEIVCEHDGSKPKDDGVLVQADPNLTPLCVEMAACGQKISELVSNAAQVLVAPPVPADAALSPADMGAPPAAAGG